MFVRKFEGDTLDETLKAVKRELGPDAIILKTVTNKGLKGAFKKKRIEITAAISEQNYERKAKVDHVLDTDQQERFYQAPAKEINTAINQYNGNPAAPSAYGNLGLNKVVNTVSKASKKIQSSLDDFLTTEEAPKTSSENFDQFMTESAAPVVPSQPESRTDSAVYEVELQKEKARVNEVSAELGSEIKSQKHQIELLEQKLYELTEKLGENQTQYKEPQGIIELRQTLRSLDLSERLVIKIIKKASFELTPDDLEDSDTLYEFALRELSEVINVGMPHFSKSEAQDTSNVTALISENTCGQASMALKLAVLQENVKIIRFRQRKVDQGKADFTSRIFKLDICEVETLSHLMSEARKAVEDGQSLILDLRLDFAEENESKKFIETLKRSFDQIEFLICLSGIHSEMYNRKILSKYHAVSSGVTMSYIDQCMSFGSIVNVHSEFNTLPLMFYSTGAVVPDDIEAATAERILAGMFQL